MNSEESKTSESAPLSAQIFEAFIKELRTTDISSDIINNLEEAIVKKQSTSEHSLRTAFFPDPPSI